MIPYIHIETINLGFLKIQFWGLMVSLGFIVGMVVDYFLARLDSRLDSQAKQAARLAKKQGLDLKKFADLIFWVIIFSLLGGRIFFVLFYQWGYFAQHLLDIFKIWQGGMSVIGGFIGALAVFIFYVKEHKLDPWQWADALIFGLPLGLAIGRIGCFFIHDHIGIKTNFFLGVNFPEGGRFDLGLLLMLSDLALFIIFLLVRKFAKEGRIFTGLYTIIFSIYYGLVRFLLDFLRVWDGPTADARYYYLTPAQYASIILLCFGVYFLAKRAGDTKQ